MKTEKDWEPMLGYCMDRDGQHEKPVRLNSSDELMEFLVANVEKYHELRVTDMMDLLTMHVVNRSLIFPVPEGRSDHNKWNSERRIFLEE